MEVQFKFGLQTWRKCRVYDSFLLLYVTHGFCQDMDLLNEQRSLIHTGKLLRQPDSGVGWEGWTELFVLLFDNYSKLQ